MAENYQSNRRHNLRVHPHANYPVYIDINGDNFVDIFRATDISSGGIGITVPHNFEGCKIDLPISMIITLPSPVSRSVTIEGKINHIVGEKFGVEYISVETGKIKMIRRYISEQLSEEPFITRMLFSMGFR